MTGATPRTSCFKGCFDWLYAPAFIQKPQPTRMFGQSKPVVLEPYGRRRARGRPPRWLVLLLTGVVIGAVGVLVVQERYLPPRLSAGESTKLRNAFEEADTARLRLQGELADTAKKLDATLVDKKSLANERRAA